MWGKKIHIFDNQEHQKCSVWIVVVQLFNHVWVFATSWTAARQASLLSFTISLSPGVCSNSRSLSRWCHSTISSSVAPSSPALNLSQHQGLFQMSALYIKWPKYWNFSISPSSEYSCVISFRIDWFDHLAVQGTFESLLQHHKSKPSILQCPVFIMVQLSHPYMMFRA